MSQVRTYAVTVLGFSPILYSARSPGKARARCYRDYLSYRDSTTFKEFLGLCAIMRVPDPPDAHQRILVCGKPATRIISNRGHAIQFMYDGSDEVFCAHPSEVQEVAADEVEEQVRGPSSAGATTPPLPIRGREGK